MNDLVMNSFTIQPKRARRPVVLLGLSKSEEYIADYKKWLEHSATRDLAEAVTVFTIHFSPDTPVPNIWRIVAEFQSWQRKNDPIYLSAWIDDTNWNGEAVQVVLTFYASYVEQLADSTFDRNHGACLTLSERTWDTYHEMKKNNSILGPMQRVWEASKRRPDNGFGIYGCDSLFNSADFAVMQLAYENPIVPWKVKNAA